MGSCDIIRSRRPNFTIVVVLSLAVAVPGCIEPLPPDGCTDPMPFTVKASTWECNMSDVGRWDAIIWICTYGEDAEFPIEGLSLDGDLLKGDGSGGPSYRYIDADGDGLISMDDKVEFLNISEQHLTTYNLTWMGESLVQFTVEWDYGDLGSFLITVTNYPVKLEEDGSYSVTNPVIETQNDSLLRFEEIEMTFESRNGTQLGPVATGLYDMDGNGFISRDDRFWFNNLTIEYRGGQVFYWVSDHLVGRSHLSKSFSDKATNIGDKPLPWSDN